MSHTLAVRPGWFLDKGQSGQGETLLGPQTASPHASSSRPATPPGGPQGEVQGGVPELFLRLGGMRFSSCPSPPRPLVAPHTWLRVFRSTVLKQRFYKTRRKTNFLSCGFAAFIGPRRHVGPHSNTDHKRVQVDVAPYVGLRQLFVVQGEPRPRRDPVQHDTSWLLGIELSQVRRRGALRVHHQGAPLPVQQANSPLGALSN